jgi:hypothetical protein
MLDDPLKIEPASLSAIYDGRCAAASSELVIGFVSMPSMNYGSQECADALEITEIGGVGFAQNGPYLCPNGIERNIPISGNHLGGLPAKKRCGNGAFRGA